MIPPERFDYREKWPNCIHRVASQQNKCGASYAQAVSQTFAERLCISSKEEILYNLSAQELLSCDTNNKGCKGGHLNNSLDYIKSKGLVEESCFPYEADSDTVKCDKKCNDMPSHKAEGYCLLTGEDDIKREIYQNGPVISVTPINIDMLTYKSGVYSKGEDIAKFNGFHTVKIVGWGVESGAEDEPNKDNKYWIIQNTWGEDWGENGYMRVSHSHSQEYLYEQFAYGIKVKDSKAIHATENIAHDSNAEKNEEIVEDINLSEDIVEEKSEEGVVE